jgi:hypothetical protein
MLRAIPSDIPQDGCGEDGRTAPTDGSEIFAAIGYGLTPHVCERLSVRWDGRRWMSTRGPLSDETVIIRWMRPPQV